MALRGNRTTDCGWRDWSARSGKTAPLRLSHCNSAWEGHRPTLSGPFRGAGTDPAGFQVYDREPGARMSKTQEPANRNSALHWAVYSVVTAIWSVLVILLAIRLSLGDRGPFTFALGLSRDNFEFALLLSVPVVAMCVFAGSSVLFLFSGRHQWLMWPLGLTIPLIAAIPVAWVAMAASV